LSSLQIHRSFKKEDAVFVTRFAVSFVLDIALKQCACSSLDNEALHYGCCLQSIVRRWLCVSCIHWVLLQLE